MKASGTWPCNQSVQLLSAAAGPRDALSPYGTSYSEHSSTARWLKEQSFIEKVTYPGLEENRYHAVAKKYLPNGAGGVLSFVVKVDLEKAVRLVEHLKLVSHLANVGDAKTLIIQPSATTHSQLSPGEQLAAGVEPGLFRVSVGLEHIDDIINDFSQAFNKIL